MKKYIFMVAAMLLAFNAGAQKLQKPVIDKITGDTTLETKEEPMQSKLSLSTHLIGCSIMKGKGIYLCFHLREGFVEWDFYVSAGDKAIIKFADGKLIELDAAFEDHSSIHYDATPIFTAAYFYYSLNGGDIDQLKNNKIAVIRINTSMGNFDYDISDGKSEIVKKQLELIAK
ncbi:hypothetical protein JN11_04196 [Mucilaginibacter frigoritolerans]|jgi:hypothetical protein|uniref:Uncharacterized protein n=1 Tax=Mucilaginibacter frigoritolerans TaxID=652788 RepID=A0A562TQP0_9SPHI|nr:hypothetical protein [Mucilaginibacter frigoritolerans]TWI95921.1 hypothetical protein JN11_04196 [Mucilaginibacter frigoritolerans]